MFTLYTTPLSANGRKPLAVAAHLGLEPVVEVVNVYRGDGLTPAFRAISPLGKIPALLDGELRLTESNAVIQYVDEAYGQMVLSSPRPETRADIARWMHWESSHWQPELTLVLAPTVAFGLGLAPKPAHRPYWTAAGLVPHLALLEAHLGQREWLVTDRPTLADFSVAGMATYFRYTDFPFGAYPGIAAWLQRMDELEAWRATEVAPWARV